MQEKLQRKKCVILPLANTDLYTSDRISISYYTSPLKPSYKLVQRLYLRHGNLVVSIVSSPKVNVHRTLRATLIALALYPKFLRYLPRVRSAYILKNWVKAFCYVNERRYTHYPLATLFKEAQLSMESMRNSISGGRVTVISSRNVKDMLISLHVSLLTLTGYTIKQRNSSQSAKLR